MSQDCYTQDFCSQCIRVCVCGQCKVHYQCIAIHLQLLQCCNAVHTYIQINSMYLWICGRLLYTICILCIKPTGRQKDTTKRCSYAQLYRAKAREREMSDKQVINFVVFFSYSCRSLVLGMLLCFFFARRTIWLLGWYAPDHKLLNLECTQQLHAERGPTRIERVEGALLDYIRIYNLALWSF